MCGESREARVGGEIPFCSRGLAPHTHDSRTDGNRPTEARGRERGRGRTPCESWTLIPVSSNLLPHQLRLELKAEQPGIRRIITVSVESGCLAAAVASLDVRTSRASNFSTSRGVECASAAASQVGERASGVCCLCLWSQADACLSGQLGRSLCARDEGSACVCERL